MSTASCVGRVAPRDVLAERGDCRRTSEPRSWQPPRCAGGAAELAATERRRRRTRGRPRRLSERMIAPATPTISRARSVSARRFTAPIAWTSTAPPALLRLRWRKSERTPTLSPMRRFAPFTKARGRSGEMVVGDRYVIQLAGPWKGAVEVIDVTPRSFRFATLEGHMESGVIEMRAAEAEDTRRVQFTIESWARSHDRAFDADLRQDRTRPDAAG